MNKCLLSPIIFCFLMQTVSAQRAMPLYPDSIPNSRPSKDQEVSEKPGGILIISKISRPTLTAYLPPKEKATGAAVVICPGGGYWVVAAGHEGADVALAFNKIGVAAFVLKYRIPNDSTMIDRRIGPLQDAQQAIKTVRDNAAKWHIDPRRLGVMGFSAGGHLASTLGTHYSESLIPNAGNTNLRPDFLMLIYPVISFRDSIGHIGSREQLIGKDAAASDITRFSNELQVTDSTPPTFLVHAADDDGVNPKNSIVFYQALVDHHVPAELHIYQSGGHGFGLRMKKSKDLWMDRCRNWMDANGWLHASAKN